MNQKIFWGIVFSYICIISPLLSDEWKSKNLRLSFSIETRFGTVKGKFSGLTSKINDYKNGKASVEVDVSTIDTGSSMRDDHLKNEDFFYIEKFPKANFEFISITPTDDPLVFNAKGKLTLKNISKQYDFTITKKENGDLSEIEGSFPVNRKDYGMEYNSFINPIKDIAILNFSASLEKIKGNQK